MRALLIIILACFILHPDDASAQKDTYLDYIREAAAAGIEAHPGAVARWRANVNPSELWGYNSPSQPIYLADVLGFLYEETSDQQYAVEAGRILAAYGDLRDAYPDDYYETRIEYQDGVPALSNFFFLPPYVRAYMRIRSHGTLDMQARERIERDLAHSLDFHFSFPEWGAHNRAMLRAEGWYYGTLALPDHPHAERWKQMAANIASDNLNQWEVEDASGYQAVWLVALFSYADIAGIDDLFDQPIMKYYAEYLKHLFTPAMAIADYGDASWNPTWDRYTAIFERFATEYQDPEHKWLAQQLFEANQHRKGVGAASNLALAYRWTDENIPTQQPTAGSMEVMEDMVGKKIVFRNGWDPQSTYLLFNYRDEGDGGLVHRDYLRQTLSVEEEKMHHGQADENSIALLMDGGSVLLHESGYRSGLPSGEFGAYRADYYHNRVIARLDKPYETQPLESFIRNSGAYRPVTTKKVDFLSLDNAEMSRTRLIDDDLGYTSDRIIVYLKEENVFLVVDAIKVLRSDYFTFTNLWHTRRLHEEGPGYFATSIDSIQQWAFPDERRLLIEFPDTGTKKVGHFTQDRHGQQEIALYTSDQRYFRAGDLSVFTTLLTPYSPEDSPGSLINQVSVLETSDRAGLGLTYDGESGTHFIGLKLDLDHGLSRENIRPLYTRESGTVAYGPFETDAHFFHAVQKNTDLHYAVSQFTSFSHQGDVLIEATPNTFGLQLDGSPARASFAQWRLWQDVKSLP